MDEEPSPDAHKPRVPSFTPVANTLEEPISWNG